MTDSRDEQQAHWDSRDGERAGSARAAEEGPASFRDHEDDAPQGHFAEHGRPGADTGGDGGDPGGAGDDADRVVTTVVNPRIVPAGSRTPAPRTPEPSRTRMAVLAAVAALAITGLSTGAYALYGGSDDEEISRSGAAPGPEWKGGQENDAPGVASPPSRSSPGEGDGKKPGGGRSSDAESPGDEGGDRPPEEDDEDSPAPEEPPGGPGGGGGADGTVRIGNHNSDQCINVPEGQVRDGMFLEIRTCSGASSMKWTFEDDGTVRAGDLCMDVANGSTEDGAVIQLAYCSGNPAQQFVLSEASDLVNPQADKCVAVRNGEVRSGEHLELRTCSGEDSQKWSPA